MDSPNLYEIYQENLLLLENQLAQVKRMTQINFGKYYYEKSKTNIPGVVKRLEFDILASTRLYTFLLCSWFETRLYKILYENSSVAFTGDERDSVLSARSMSEKWKRCLNLSICKSYGFEFSINQRDYFHCFDAESEALDFYKQVYEYLNDIDDAIMIRNKLAHGQWKTILNRGRTNFAGLNIQSFFNTNNNIQKLDLLYNIYKLITDIISSYVVYKDKVSTDAFHKNLKQKIDKINSFKQRMEKAYKC